MPEIGWHLLNTIQYESTNVGIFIILPTTPCGSVQQRTPQNKRFAVNLAVWLALVLADFVANKSLRFRGYYIFITKYTTHCVLHVFFLGLIATLILRFELNYSLKCFRFPPLMAAVPHTFPSGGSIKDYFVSSLMAKTEWRKTLHIKTNAIFVRNLSALVSVHARIKSARSNLCALAVWITHTHVWNTGRAGSAQHDTAQSTQSADKP